MPGLDIEILQAAKREGMVSFYATTDEGVDLIVAEFKKRLPFVQVEQLQLPGGALAQRFAAEQTAGKAAADVAANTNESVGLDWAAKGWCATYTPTDAQKLSAAVPNVVYRYEGFAIVVAWTEGTLAKQDIETLKTWSGLMDSRFKGKRFAVVEVAAGGSTLYPNTYFYKEFGTTLWQKYVDNASVVRIFASGKPALQALLQGEVDIAAPTNSQQVQSVWLSGAPIAWVTPKPTLLVASTGCVVKSAPHPNAARLLWEFILSKKSQELMLSVGDASYRTDIDPQAAMTGQAADLLKRPWYAPPDITQPYLISPQEIASLSREVTEKWRAIFNARK
jgi:iron(III) transport system substrate-binding protein